MQKFFFVCLLAIISVTASGIAYSATTWYIPEGSTLGSSSGAWDLWILITNPNSQAVHCHLTFYKQDATTTECDTIVSANSRSSIQVSTISGMTNQGGISTKVECVEGDYNGTSYTRLPIYAERALYMLNAGRTEWTFGHSARGISGTEGCYMEIGQPSSFPVTISTAGSYKLISNITCSDTSAEAAIKITASNVTLDLNGFTVAGPGKSASGTTYGVYAMGTITTPIYNILIKDGNVRDFSEDGVLVLYSINSRVDDIMAFNNGGRGINVSASENAKIESCQADSNTTYGLNLNASNYSVLKNCVSTNNDYGILVGGTGLYNRVEGNHSVNNTTSDIHIFGNYNIAIYNTSNIAISTTGSGNQTTYNNGLNSTL